MILRSSVHAVTIVRLAVPMTFESAPEGGANLLKTKELSILCAK